MAAEKRKSIGEKEKGEKKMPVSIKKIFEKENTTKLLVKGVPIEIMNAIRRNIMEHVECLAIEDIAIYENNSVMFDELLGHRLGMLPIKTDMKGYKQGDKVKLVLEKEGPCTVYSKDIKSTDPKIDVADKKIPIVKLDKGQTIKIEMDAIMGSGKEHVKWQPAVIAYQELAAIKSTSACNECQDCIKACPKNVIELKAKKVVLKDSLGCILCMACKDACKEHALEVNVEPESYILTIETQGALSTKDCIFSAITNLKNKTKEFEKGLSKKVK